MGDGTGGEMNHRRPPLPESWNDERGFCRWCGRCIVGQDGRPLWRRRWHPECVAEYRFLFWPAETSTQLCNLRGEICEDCGQNLAYTAREVHHIVPLLSYPHCDQDPYAAWREGNLILLCHDCHQKAHRDIRYLAKYRNPKNRPKQLALALKEGS